MKNEMNLEMKYLESLFKMLRIRATLCSMIFLSALSAAATEKLPPVNPIPGVKATPATLPKATLSKDTIDSSDTPQAGQSDGRVLWDSWYIVTLQKKIPYAYYHDHAEIRQGRVVFQNHFWKNEEGYINEEQVGAFAQNDANLTPLFFNFHSTYRSTELMIDGNVQDGKILTVKVRRGDKDLPVIKKNLPTKVFFSSLFQVWIGKHLAGLKAGASLPFLTVLEDNLDLGFSAVHGRMTVDKPDAYAQKTGTTRLKVEHQDKNTVWYVEPNGNPIRIEMPEQHALVERVPESVAKKFLNVP
ncbi:MAG: hypothetical protein H7222_06355 [Methylotenera sp.]|nr:hypothetical protein [Oligoflexia bacterium]